jgi:hypothetical protein
MRLPTAARLRCGRCFSPRMVRTAGMSSRDLVRSMIRSGSLIVAGGEAVGQFGEADGLAGEASFRRFVECSRRGNVTATRGYGARNTVNSSFVGAPVFVSKRNRVDSEPWHDPPALSATIGSAPVPCGIAQKAAVPGVMQ